MKIYDELPQHLEDGTANPDWLSLRAGKFTGSDFSVMLGNGETKRKMILEKATEHILGKPCNKDHYVSADMLRGIELESVARNLYIEETFNDVKEVGFIEKDEYCGVSPDGLVSEDGIIEIKCPKDTVFVEQSITGNIKPEYYTQIQYALYITGRQWCDYVAYNENFPLLIRRYERDEKYIEKIKDALEDGIEQVKQIILKFRNIGNM
jgi:putative phage-type endonuclease